MEIGASLNKLCCGILIPFYCVSHYYSDPTVESTCNYLKCILNKPSLIMHQEICCYFSPKHVFIVGAGGLT